MAALSSAEVDAAREAFLAFEREGRVDLDGLRAVLGALGDKPTEEELFTMVSGVDSARTGEIGERVRACEDAGGGSGGGRLGGRDGARARAWRWRQ